MNLLLEIVATIDPKMAADETSARFQQINEIYSQLMDPIAIDGSVTAEDTLAEMEAQMTEVLQE